MTTTALTRSRMEFAFEVVREDGTCLAKGTQAVVWVNPQHRLSLMPDKLYESVASYFGVGDWE